VNPAARRPPDHNRFIVASVGVVFQKISAATPFPHSRDGDENRARLGVRNGSGNQESK
jgi:hypothetical protein